MINLGDLILYKEGKEFNTQFKKSKKNPIDIIFEHSQKKQSKFFARQKLVTKYFLLRILQLLSPSMYSQYRNVILSKNMLMIVLLSFKWFIKHGTINRK